MQHSKVLGAILLALGWYAAVGLGTVRASAPAMPEAAPVLVRKMPPPDPKPERPRQTSIPVVARSYASSLR